MTEINRAGFGRPGWCKLCSLKDPQAQDDLDARCRADWNARQLGDLLRDRYQITVNRQTIYAHQKHAMHPKDRIVTAVQKSEQRALQTKPVASNEQFLEAIREAGYQRAMTNPDEVTIDHGLKAAQILASQKQSGGNAIFVLVRAVTGGGLPPDDVVDGDFREENSEQ